MTLNDLPQQAPSEEMLRDRKRIAFSILVLAAAIAAVLASFYPFRGPTELSHVSFDASREYYAALNAAYTESLAVPDSCRVIMSHAGSVRQVSNLARGQVADIVSLASQYDLQSVAIGRSPNGATATDQLTATGTPFYSTIAVVTRAGNPKGIADWADLWRPDVRVAIPSPAASGAGRWAFLALYAAALDSDTGKLNADRLQSLFLRIVLIDTGARSALAIFAGRSELDAFLTWESDALQLADLGFESLASTHLSPSVKILPQAAAMTRHTNRRGTGSLAADYLAFQFSETGQNIAATSHFRPIDEAVLERFQGRFPSVELFAIESVAPSGPGVWNEAFGKDGLFERFLRLRFAQSGGRE